MATTLLYGRSYLFQFIPTNASDEAVTFGQAAAPGKGVKELGLAVQFVVNNTAPLFATSTSSTATIRIYNLRQETQRALVRPGYYSLSTGHGGNLDEIFLGVLSGSSVGFEGNDTYIELVLRSSPVQSKNRFFQASYGPRSTTAQILTDLDSYLSAANASVYSLNVDFSEIDPRDDELYPNPKVVQGDPLTVIDQLINAPGRKRKYWVYAELGLIRIVPRLVNNVAGPVIKFGRDYGQIDYIRFTGSASDDDDKTNYASVNAQSVLNPKIAIGVLMKLQLDTNKDKFPLTKINPLADPMKRGEYHYQVSQAIHSGNTFSGDYRTQWAGKLIRTEATG